MKRLSLQKALRVLVVGSMIANFGIIALPASSKINKEALETKVALTAPERSRISLSKEAKKNLNNRSKKFFIQGLQSHGKKKFKTAIEYYERVLKAKPGLFEAEYNIGLCQEELGQFTKARESFGRLVKADPVWDLGYKHLAYIAFKQGDHESASGYHAKYLSVCRP